MNWIGGGLVWAKILRSKRIPYPKDDGDTGYLQLLNIEHWCRNQFQVTRQVTMDKGSYKNRYDVTLLINGLSLAQIELKRRGLEMKEAFNQINRYKRHSFWSSRGLFNYVQLFIISNGVNTKYFANSGEQLMPFKFTNFWADTDNRKITQLTDFADAFLEKRHLSKMICKYTVIPHEGNTLMFLQPYQFHAVEAIIDRVKNSDKHGYIWDTRKGMQPFCPSTFCFNSTIKTSRQIKAVCTRNLSSNGKLLDKTTPKRGTAAYPIRIYSII